MRNWIRKRIGKRCVGHWYLNFADPFGEGARNTGAGQGWRHIGKRVLAAGKRSSDFKSITWPEQDKTEAKRCQDPAGSGASLAPPQN
jgi:hypothetical protein